MAANACCAVCGCFSAFFCLCQEPEKLFLCTGCLPVHMTKGGGHSLFPNEAAGVVKASDDMKVYNTRRELVSELLAKLESLQLKVKSEQQEMPGLINELYTQQVHDLYTAYIHASEQLSLFYSNIDAEIEELKAQFQKQLEQREIQLSESASLFLKCAAHAKWATEITVSSVNELKAWLTLPNKPLEPQSLRKTLQRWACSGCSQCSLLDQKHFSSGRTIESRLRDSINPSVANLRLQEALPSVEPRPEIKKGSPYWTCERCSYEYNWQTIKCTKCQHRNPNKEVSQQSLKQPAEISKAWDASLRWACTTCGYERNSSYFSRCGTCGTKNNRVEEEKKKGEIVERGRKNWECHSCSTINGPQRMRCTLCGSLKSIPQ